MMLPIWTGSQKNLKSPILAQIAPLKTISRRQPNEQNILDKVGTGLFPAMFPPIVVLLTPYVYRATDVPYKVEI